MAIVLERKTIGVLASPTVLQTFGKEKTFLCFSFFAYQNRGLTTIWCSGQDSVSQCLGWALAPFLIQLPDIAPGSSK